MASDDQDVMAWYLQGWCFFLMAEKAKETGIRIEDLTWEELARDARECLETCKTVGLFMYMPVSYSSRNMSSFIQHFSIQMRVYLTILWNLYDNWTHWV